jgi:hypothetical protein
MLLLGFGIELHFGMHPTDSAAQLYDCPPAAKAWCQSIGGLPE